MPRENFELSITIKSRDLIAFLKSKYPYLSEDAEITSVKDDFEIQDWWQGGDYRGAEFTVKTNYDFYKTKIAEMKAAGQEIEG